MSVYMVSSMRVPQSLTDILNLWFLISKKRIDIKTSIKRLTCSILCFWIGTIWCYPHHEKNFHLPVWIQKVCQLDQCSDPAGLIKLVGHHFCLWSNDWWVQLMEMYHNKVVATIPDHSCWLVEKTSFGWKLTCQLLLHLNIGSFMPIMVTDCCMYLIFSLCLKSAYVCKCLSIITCNLPWYK